MYYCTVKCDEGLLSSSEVKVAAAGAWLLLPSVAPAFAFVLFSRLENCGKELKEILLLCYNSVCYEV